MKKALGAMYTLFKGLVWWWIRSRYGVILYINVFLDLLGSTCEYNVRKPRKINWIIMNKVTMWKGKVPMDR